MANMDIWNALKNPPKDALKEIKGGRLKGMTDISPQWRYEAMTAQFGPVGMAWKYEISKLWEKELSSGEVMCFATVKLYYWNIETWSDPIPGIGGSMLVAKESSGLHASDEGYKMAVTDALSVAMKTLGVGADVYRGKWDGSKYKEEPKEPVKIGQFHAGAGLVEELYAIAKEQAAVFEDVLAVATHYAPDNVDGKKIKFSEMSKEGYLAIREAFEKGIWKEVIRKEPAKEPEQKEIF